MQIHTVKPGDTIFKIAREYSVSPMKIIENNELMNPDRLAVGQELLILTPTRTYSVRGSDTLKRIADRFSVKYPSLLAKNPYLAGSDKIYPGQILAIKYDTPLYGMAAANGYYYKNTKKDRLAAAIPYLTYITVSAGKRNGDEIELGFDDAEIVNLARQDGKIPLMRVYDTETSFSDKYADTLALMAKTHGFGGITLAAYRALVENPSGYTEFLLSLKRKLMELDLLLFCELDGNRTEIIEDVCDGYVIMYEKDADGNTPAEDFIMKNFAENSEPSKAYMEIPSYAYMGDEIITKAEAENLAYTHGYEIKKDSNGFCYFNHNIYKSGKKDTVRVMYESLESIKAKLSNVGELGFMGIHFDISNIPIEYLMLFETMFTKPTYFSGAM